MDEPNEVVEPTQPVEPDPAVPVEPDYEAILEEEKASREKLEQELSQAKSAADARMQQLEQLVSNAFQQPAAQEPAPVEISDEIFQERPRESTEFLIQREVDKRLQENNRQMGQVLRGIAEQTFDAEYREVARKPMFEKVRDHVDNFFTQNPGEKLRPGAVANVYKYQLGEYVEQQGMPERNVAPPTPTPSPPTAPAAAPTEPTWPSAAHERTARAFGIEDPKEWNEINNGDKFPKRERRR